MDVARLGYERSGRGAPLLLLHGISHRREVWRPVVRHLGGRFTALAVDLPGCGESPAPAADEAYDVPALAEAVAQWCARMGLERPHLAGNSLGGAIALELGARGRAASVTTFSPIGFGNRFENAALRGLVQGMLAASLVPAQVRSAAADSAPLRALARRTLRADPHVPAAREVRFNTSVLERDSPFLRLAPEVARYGFTASHIPCPVTVAWGVRDRILPPWIARRAQARIPGARLVRLLDCGHIPMVDDPAAVAETIAATCARGSGR